MKRPLASLSVRVTVIETASASAGLREAVRSALEQVDHEIDYSTDGGTNIFERLVDRDAVVVLDSHLDRITAVSAGFSFRTLPHLVVIDSDGSPMFRKGPSDGRFFRGDWEDDRALLAFLADGLESIEVDPAPFLSMHIRPRLGEATARDTVFISYSHKDSSHLDRLLVHLEPLRRDNVVKYWSDQQLNPGSRWREEIARSIEKAAIAILLVSPDFLASAFITTDELPPLLLAAKGEGAVILPIVLRPCRFKRDAELSAFQAFQSGTPIAMLNEVEQDGVWDAVAAEVERRFVADRS